MAVQLIYFYQIIIDRNVRRIRHTTFQKHYRWQLPYPGGDFFPDELLQLLSQQAAKGRARVGSSCERWVRADEVPVCVFKRAHCQHVKD